MNTHFFSCKVLLILAQGLLVFLVTPVSAQSRLQAAAGRAVVVDERLSVLRASPATSGKLLRRIGRGRAVTILGQRSVGEGIVFCHVAVSSRTRGWMQRDALVSARRQGDDERLMRLIIGSKDFDLIARSRIFLNTFPRSPLRPAVLLLIGDAAEQVAARLSRDASRRLNKEEMAAGGAPVFSYFLNYSGLDRYSRQGVRFVFDRAEQRFHYDGAAWREILRRHSRSDEAREARKRLDDLSEILPRKR